MHADLVCALCEVDRVAGVVGSGPGDDRVSRADLFQRRLVEREPLLVGQRRCLPGRAGDHDPVRAVVDEVTAERAEAIEGDRAAIRERRHGRGEECAEHPVIVTPRAVRY